MSRSEIGRMPGRRQDRDGEASKSACITRSPSSAALKSARAAGEAAPRTARRASRARTARRSKRTGRNAGRLRTCTRGGCFATQEAPSHGLVVPFGRTRQLGDGADRS